MPKKDFYSKQKYKRNPKRTTYPVIPKIKPGADPKLNKVFDSVGIPDNTNFTPDPFQLKAIDAINTSDCLVTAPTGSGKTWIAEQAILNILEKKSKIQKGKAQKNKAGEGRTQQGRTQKGRTWYGTPLKALTNTIYHHFQKIFGEENVGILTGDIKSNPDAPIIIGTTEILRNQLYDSMQSGEDLQTDFVILDEAHFLGDIDRGVVWEEIMIYLPVRIPLLMLSATIGNAHVIASWLSSIRKKECIVIEESKRPVPLAPVFFHPSGTLFPLTVKDDKKKKNKLYKKVVQYLNSTNPPVLCQPRKLPPMGDVLKVLREYNLLPAIFFLKSRADCDAAIKLCTGENLDSDPVRKDLLKKRIEELTSKDSHISNHKQRWHLEQLAVGSHHSGQLPAWKIIVETLMAEGLLDAMFATSTVAAGVNFPARTVVILNSDRYNGSEFISLTPTEFQQMAGRAGRRGMDKIGFAIMLPGKFMNIRMMAKLTDAPPSSITSQIKINFSMVLNLLLSHTPRKIKILLNKSFASYLISVTKRKKFFGDDMEYLWRDFSLHLDFLVSEGFVTKKGILTEDGIWTSQLRIDSPLLVAESLRLGVLPDDNPAMLAAFIASFVNERESDDNNVSRSSIPKELISIFLKVKKSLMPITRAMLKKGFDASPLYLQPAATIFRWASGESWEDVIKTSNLVEGDLARLILRTADNLRHLKNLKNRFPDTSETAINAIDLIMKEPVISFYSNEG